MSVVKKGMSAAAKLGLLAIVLATFLVGFFAVGYLQLRGQEVTVPKIVGKNLNEGTDELERAGLRIRKVASRYSEEKPNTILEQRPKADTIAKSGLIISVVVAQANQDGDEAPVGVVTDDDAIEEIEALPELKTDSEKTKPKNPKAKPTPKKPSTKTRDVIKTVEGAGTSEGDKIGTGEDKKVDSVGTTDKTSGDKTVKPLYTPKPKSTPATSDRPKAGNNR